MNVRTINGVKQVMLNMVGLNNSFKDKFKKFIYDNECHAISGIDPGFNTSLCHINEQRILILQISAPLRIHHLQKMKYLNSKFQCMLYRCNFENELNLVYIEDAEVWGSMGAQGKNNIGKASLKSEVSSAKGDLLKLARVIGMYCGTMFDYSMDFELLPAIQWKGQLTKKATEKWIYDSLPELIDYKLTEHMLDSIGICLSKIYDWKTGINNASNKNKK